MNNRGRAIAIALGLISAAGLQSPLSAQPAPPPLRPGPQFGFGFDASPEGAVIKIVVSGSAAAQAGLAPGMVVARLDGRPLEGLDQQSMIQLFLAAPDEVTLTILGRGEVKLRRAESPAAASTSPTER